MTTPLVRPFAGLRPAPELASEVAAPPYDVVSSDEARALAEGHPLSFLHISKPEIDLPSGTDVHAPEVYAKGAENMERMIADGVIRRDGQPCYYVYRIQMGDHVQTGIVGGGSVAAYDDNRIRRHEFTRPEKEDDRVNQIEAVNAQTGPVFTVHHPDAGIDGVVNKMTQTKPVYEVDLPGTHHSTHHSLWVVDDAADIGAISDAFDAMDVIYIADGHHRSAAASRVAVSRAAKDSASNGDQPYDYFLIVSFPTDAVQIFDYNRVVTDLNGLSVAELLDRLQESFDVEAQGTEPYRPEGIHTLSMYLEGTWYRLTANDSTFDDLDPIRALDVTVLSECVLAPIFNITDLRKDKRIDFVGGIRGLDELSRRVDSGEMAVAFALHEVSMEQLISIADTGNIMPPKTTWFEPKLRSGLVVHKIV